MAQLVIALAGAEHFYFEWYDYERPDLVSDAPGDDEGEAAAEGLLLRRGLSAAARIGAAGLRRLQLVDDRDISASMLNGTAAAVPQRGFNAVDSYSPHALALMEVF